MTWSRSRLGAVSLGLAATLALSYAVFRASTKTKLGYLDAPADLAQGRARYFVGSGLAGTSLAEPAQVREARRRGVRIVDTGQPLTSAELAYNAIVRQHYGLPP